jgi:hypothetical protein
MSPARKALALITAAALLMPAAPAWPQNGRDRAALGALADYEVKLAIYDRARSAYERAHAAYWNAVSSKRKLRNAKRRKHETMQLADYVLTQPPVYSGPPRPVSPLPPPAPPKPLRPEIPVIADFLAAAKEQWGFMPDQPASDAAFTRA